MSVLVDHHLDFQLQSVTKEQELLEKRVSFLWQRLCLLERKELFRQCTKTTRGVAKAVSELDVADRDIVRQETSNDFVDVESPCVRPLSKPEHVCKSTATSTSCATSPSRVQEWCRGFRAQVRTVCRSLDSDGTESSSGGESDDELEIPPKKRLSQPCAESLRVARAEYESGRAQIAARMSWLYSQVADLNYRIRYQGEMLSRHRSVHRPVRYSSQHSRRLSVSSVSSQTSIGSLDNDTTAATGGDGSASAVPPGRPGGEHSARTHPVPALPRRKLYKWSEPSHDILEQLPAWESSSWLNHVYDSNDVTDGAKSAHAPTIMEQLDHCFHPVLSFHSDIPLSVCIENSVRHQEHQAPSLHPPCSIRRSSFQHAKKQRTSRLKKLAKENGARSPIIHAVKRRNSASGSATASNGSTSALLPTTPTPASAKKTYDGSRRPKGISLSEATSSNSRTPVRRCESTGGTPTMATPASAGPFTRQHSLSATKRQKRATSTSYDINSIVVQYAAPARVEKLNYKEIKTPRWRICDILTESLASAVAEEEEDLSDDSFRLRHLRMEALERERFQGSDKKKRARASMGGSLPTTPDATLTAPPSPAFLNLPQNLSYRAADTPSLPVPTFPVVATPIPQDDGTPAASISSRKSSRKTTSLSRSLSSNAEAAEPTPFVSWEQRTFPLSDADCEQLTYEDPIPIPQSRSSSSCSLSPSFLRAHSMPASLPCSRTSPTLPSSPTALNTTGAALTAVDVASQPGTGPTSPCDKWSSHLPSPTPVGVDPEEGKLQPLVLKLTKHAASSS